MLCKSDAQSIKFFQHQKPSHVIVYQKNRDILIVFDENFLFFTSLMKSRLINAHESFSSSLMNRSQFDEMRLSESFLKPYQMINRSQFDEIRSSESSHQKHIRRSTSQERIHVA